MNIERIAGCTRMIGESQGYIGLPLRDEIVTDSATGATVCQMTSRWRPTPEELTALLNGGCVYLSVFGHPVKPSHPPVRLYVE